MQQKWPTESVHRFKKTVFAALVAGAVITVLVAWACALWAPSRFAFDPFENPSRAVDTADTDGMGKGLHYEQGGFGWAYTYLRGGRYWLNGKPDVIWMGPYGGIYHRVAGWPFHALRSRVEVLDSQVSNSFSEDDLPPNVVPVIPQRRSWELPWREILYRGVASKDFPAWMGPQPDRRLPLIPMPLPFLANVIFYGAGCILATSISRLLRRSVLRSTSALKRTGAPHFVPRSPAISPRPLRGWRTQAVTNRTRVS